LDGSGNADGNNNGGNDSTHSPSINPVCFNCGSTHAKLLKCGQCRVASYCQKDCQVNDWKNGQHKSYCNYYRRVGPYMTFLDDNDNDSKLEALTEVFARVRLYACPYAVYKYETLGKGFLFIQSNTTLAACSLPIPKDSYGRSIGPRSLLLHYLTIGEYDLEVCRDDFELAVVRSELKEAVDNYDESCQVVLLTRFRCGHLSVGVTPIVPDYAVCRKLGNEYYAESSTAGALQLNLDEMK